MGNTKKVKPSEEPAEDHPHIHGEHLHCCCNGYVPIGSPPQTWGTQTVLSMTHGLMRITPTYMGNTYRNQIYFPLTQDHPHIHGEHWFNFDECSYIRGSPPHTWGTPMRAASKINDARITPTYMGNTFECFILKFI